MSKRPKKKSNSQSKRYNTNEVRKLAKLVYEKINRSAVRRIFVRNLCKEVCVGTKLKWSAVLSSYKRHFQPKLARQKSRIFTNEFETHLALLSLELSLRGSALTKPQLLSIASSAIDDPKIKIGRKWYDGFMKRFSDVLKFEPVNYCEAGRDSPNHVKYAHLFFKASSMFRSSIHWNPKFIINCDEIRFQEARGNSLIPLITARDGSRPPINRLKATKGMTVLPFVVGDGTVLLVVYILPFLSKKKNCSRQSYFHSSTRYSSIGSFLNRAYVWTLKGWLTLDVWEKIVRLFIEKTKSYFNVKLGLW